MEAKKYLKQIRHLQGAIERKTKELNAMTEQAASIKAIQYDSNKVQSSPSGDAAFVDALAKIEELRDELSKEIREQVELRARIVAQINDLDDDRYSQVLYKKYVEFLPNDQVADEMGYNRGYIFCVIKDALAEFERKYLSINL